MSHGNQDKQKELEALEATMEKIKTLFRNPSATSGEKQAAKKKYNLLLPKLKALQEEVAKISKPWEVKSESTSGTEVPKNERRTSTSETTYRKVTFRDNDGESLKDLQEKLRKAAEKAAETLKEAAEKVRDSEPSDDEDYEYSYTEPKEQEIFVNFGKKKPSASSSEPDLETSEIRSRSKLPPSMAKIQVIWWDSKMYEIDKMESEFINFVCGHYMLWHGQISSKYEDNGAMLSKEEAKLLIQEKAYKLQSIDLVVRRLNYELEKRRVSTDDFNPNRRRTY